jgi:hypothetical protein
MKARTTTAKKTTITTAINVSDICESILNYWQL